MREWCVVVVIIVTIVGIDETNRHIVPGELTSISCEHVGSVEWSLNGTILMFGDNGIHIIQSGPTISVLSIGVYQDQLNGVYTCTDDNSDSITLITQGNTMNDCI